MLKIYPIIEDDDWIYQENNEVKIILNSGEIIYGKILNIYLDGKIEIELGEDLIQATLKPLK